MEKKKNSKGLIVLIVILIILLLALISYICYDKFVPKEDSTNNETTSKNELKTVTNNYILENLEEELIDYSEAYGLYFKDKIDLNSPEILKLSLLKYSEETNTSFDYFIVKDVEGNVVYELRNGQENLDVSDSRKGIEATELNSYMQEVYNTDKKFQDTWEKNQNRWVFSGIKCFYYDSRSDAYYPGLNPASGSPSYITTKIVEGKEDNDYIYLYNKALWCSMGILPFCQKAGDYSYKDVQDNPNLGYILNYSELEKETKFKDEYGDLSDEKVSESVFQEHYDELYTYKHTFKKENNNYYYVSSEVVE